MSLIPAPDLANRLSGRADLEETWATPRDTESDRETVDAEMERVYRDDEMENQVRTCLV